MLILCLCIICKHCVHQNCEQYLKPWRPNPNTRVNWGLLCTRAKGRDHEIVIAQKKVSKDCPKTPLKSCIVVMDTKCSVKPCVTDPHPNANSMNFYSCGSSHMINKTSQQLWAFGMPWSPSFVLCLPPRGGFWVTMKHDPWNPCRLASNGPSILHSHTPLVPLVWSSELGPAPDPHFPLTRMLEVQWSRALSLVSEGEGLRIACLRNHEIRNPRASRMHQTLLQSD